MAIPALVPMRFAPASIIPSVSVRVRIPPDAFTPTLSGTLARISDTASLVAPPAGRGIADPDVLARTLTAYGAPSRHRRACGFAGPGAGGGREVEALVVTRDGRVLRHATGAPDAATPGEVDAMLRALVPRDGRSADTDAAPSP
jgi:hypothetical protein